MKNRKNIIILLVSILVIAFSMIVFFIKTNGIVSFDNYIYNAISNLKCDFTTNLSLTLSRLASATILILITILLCIDLKNKKISYLVIINLLSAVILNLLLKNIFVRERPFHLMIVDESGYSFPSGHAMVSFAFYGYIIYLIYKDYLKRKHKKISYIILCLLVFLIGCSRIYLGVHYTSDILGGFIASAIYLSVYIMFSEKVIRGEINLQKRKDYLKQENKKFLNSFKYAYRGIKEAFKSERNMKVHLFIMLSVIVLGFLFEISALEWIICLISFGLVISLEIVNTSIETVVNLVSPKYNELAKRTKDLSAGAVLFNAIIAFILGIIIFLPKIIIYFSL